MNNPEQKKFYGIDGLYRFTIIENCLNHACSNNGLIFGSYIRDIIIPKSLMSDPNNNIIIRNLAIWFPTTENKENFVKVMGKEISLIYDYVEEHAEIYQLYYEGYPFIRMKIITEPHLINYKYNIDALCYNITDGTFSSISHESVEELQQQIIEKNANLVISPETIEQYRKNKFWKAMFIHELQGLLIDKWQVTNEITGNIIPDELRYLDIFNWIRDDIETQPHNILVKPCKLKIDY